MKKVNYFQTHRGDAGIQQRFGEAVDGFDLSDITPEYVAEQIANFALARYDLRVRATLRRAGIQIDDEGPLTVEVILQKVRSAFEGLDIQELSPDGLRDAIDAQLAKQLSERLGFEVSTVFDAAAAREQVKQQVLQALQDGAGAGILKGRTLHSLRMAATLSRAGPDARAALNRAYARKYRKHHAQTWE